MVLLSAKCRIWDDEAVEHSLLQLSRWAGENGRVPPTLPRDGISGKWFNFLLPQLASL